MRSNERRSQTDSVSRRDFGQSLPGIRRYRQSRRDSRFVLRRPARCAVTSVRLSPVVSTYHVIAAPLMVSSASASASSHGSRSYECVTLDDQLARGRRWLLHIVRDRDLLENTGPVRSPERSRRDTTRHECWPSSGASSRIAERRSSSTNHSVLTKKPTVLSSHVCVLAVIATEAG